MSNQFFEEDAFVLAENGIKVASEDPFNASLDMVREKLGVMFTPDQQTAGGPQVTNATKEICIVVYEDYNNIAINKMKPTIPMKREDYVQQVMAEIYGLGPIQPLLDDPSIEDIAMNGPNEIVVMKNASWNLMPGLFFTSPNRMLEMLNRAIANSNRSVNEVKPIADAILKNGGRINVVSYPVASPFPISVIRMARSNQISIGDLVKPYKAPGQTDEEAMRAREALLNAPPEKTLLPDYARLPQGGMLTYKAAKYLHAAVLAGLNIIVIGPTGVGKTTILKALGKVIPKWNRILIIEDTPEIVLYPDSDRPYNVINLRTRPPSMENLPPIPQEELVKLALRQRPDALTLGEARGEEILDLLNALNTGHKNGLTSLHAEGPDDMFRRILTMLAQSERSRNMSEYTSASLVGSTLNIVIALEMRGRTRIVSSISELTGKITGQGHNASPDMNLVFLNNGRSDGSLDGLLNDSVYADKFSRIGVDKSVYTRE